MAGVTKIVVRALSRRENGNGRRVLPWEGARDVSDGGVITWIHVAGVGPDCEVVYPGTVAEFLAARQRLGSKPLTWEYETRSFYLPTGAAVVLLVELPSDADEEDTV